LRDDSHFVFRQKLVGEDGSVRRGRCHVEAARSVLAKVWGDVFTRFHPVAAKVPFEPGIHILACWDKFFVHSPFDVKESDDHALDVAFNLSGLF